MTIRQPYNDTVYVAESPEKFTPAYVLSLGEGRVTLDDVVTGNTEGKLQPKRWLETDKFIYLTHTDGNATFHFYYDKAEGQLYSVSSDSLSFLERAESVGNGLNATYTKSQLSTLIESELFAIISPAEQEKIRSLSQDMGDDELTVIMLK
jgi:hypothetical protein